MRASWPVLLPLAALAARVAASPAAPPGVATVTRDVFGSYRVPERGGREAPVHRYTLTNGRVTVQIVEYGATITSVRVPDSSGLQGDIVLGYDTLQEYFSGDNPYFGATVGRVANRVAGGKFTLDGVTYSLYKNNGNNSIHGGLRGFDKKLWSSVHDNNRVTMEYVSPDREEGYPGQLRAVATFWLTADDTLVIEYNATASKRTPINLTNHAYFNLAGHDAGAAPLYNHTVAITADRITETDSELIPTGKLLAVSGSPYDLRQPRRMGDAIQATAKGGFDDNFVLPSHQGVVATVHDPGSGRGLEVRTSQPGLQFYTANSLGPVTGKGGARYQRHGAFCLEAQNFPDAVNHPKEFPNSVFGPSDVYHQVIKYKFVTSASSKCSFY